MSTDRGTVDATRQGGSNAGAKSIYIAPPMTLDEALEFVKDHIAWRKVLGRDGQAMKALYREVLRIRELVNAP